MEHIRKTYIGQNMESIGNNMENIGNAHKHTHTHPRIFCAPTEALTKCPDTSSFALLLQRVPPYAKPPVGNNISPTSARTSKASGRHSCSMRLG